MKIPHHTLHYVIGISALILAVIAVTAHNPNHNIIVQDLTSAQGEVIKKNRYTWPSLSQGQIISLGDSITGTDPGKVMIFCASTECKNFRTDLDDAFQIADWKGTFEDQHVDSESENGISVGPPGPDADKLAKNITAATGYQVKIVGLDGLDGLGVIIGKYEPAP